eukprot:CAMPEP_0198264636 /NCGR_PEP_ID=MMETSP1447-20131203/16270_1 /TAXON_ID=420782 /ORGANISM="Chaetoceros dichaeta, Strain CCMP1751" /LENGTH=877 /DNA_ID=CAMNT_0043953635 /DNA_START=44 /DNA_END=2677 /DNA_ORIENTATION=+
MSSIVEPESSGRFPSSLFTAVAENDFEGIVKIYASQSCKAIVSGFAMHQRVDPHRGAAFAEEKREESCHYLSGADSSFTDSRHKGEFPKDSYVSETLCGLANVIENLERGTSVTKKEMTADANFCSTQKTKSSSMLYTTSMQFQGSVHHDSTPYIPEVCKSLRQKTSEPQRPSRRISDPLQQKGKKRQKKLRQAKSRGGSEVERYLYETSMILSNSRPEPSFVVHQKVSGEEIRNTILDKQDGSDQDCANGEHVIFDGAVANYTPTGIGLRRGSGGGSGTILHLACAIDSPFALALLLVMGANVSSCHTAFQRSIFHEAACSDSTDCLRLLLEIGEDHNESMKYKFISDDETEGEQKASNINGVSLFDPRNNKKTSSSKAVTEEYARGMKTVENPTAEWKDKIGSSFVSTRQIMNPTAEWKDKVGSSFVSTLQIILQLIRKMKSNELSNFDAARSLLSEIPLTKRSSAFISASCGIRRLANDVIAMNPGPSRLSADSYSGLSPSTMKRNPMYDGHGNTALHWAAFKNAASCVDLLLSYQADPNAIARISGWTPLHDAAYSDSADSVKLLISAGADVNAKANSGATPLCFAAQEDAPNAIRVLLHAGADAAARCCEDNDSSNDHHHSSRFSGYTPLHYCAHYNAHQAAHVLLEMENQKERSTKLQEIPDLNEKLSIHIAVCRGSSAVLKELLHSGARLDSNDDLIMTLSPVHSSAHHQEVDDVEEMEEDVHPLEHESDTSQNSYSQITSISAPKIVTPLSSPVLQAMIPPEPIASSKPWNCLSQRSIDECNILLRDAELNWTPERHAIFHPRDRFAVLELLRVGKRLEQRNTGIFLELWPLVLSFCGRGWFEPESNHAMLESKEYNLNELMDFSLLNE